MNLKNSNHIYLPDVVGKGYKEFWNYKGRYRVVKGSRASKKSKTTALWIIYNMMKPEYKQANTVVFRKTYRTLRDSCYSDLLWAQNRFGVSHLWENYTSPLEMRYKPTGQKILFRGLDDSMKVTSISVENGVICWAWLEEGYELMNQSDFDVIDESIRGLVPDPLFKQWTITFNPWNDKHWLKKRFFDNPNDNVLALTTNYLCNEWLDDSDRRLFVEMKKRNPRRYQVAGLGNWGIVEGLVYENWQEREFTLEEVQNLKIACGLDFGYTNDPTAFVVAYIDEKNKRIFIWDEMYKKGLSNLKIYEQIKSMNYSKERITADSAEPKSIDELRSYGLRVKATQKGKDSVIHGIQYIQNFEIVIHPRCVNFVTEISNYIWNSDKFGNKLNVPIDDFNHLLDALRYAIEDYIRGVKFNPVIGGIL